MNIWIKAGLLAVMLMPGAASAGMVAFFDRVDGVCPQGWQPAASAKGRLILGTTEGSRVGNVSGTAMKDKTPPSHSHPLSIKYVPISKKVVAVQEFWPFDTNTGVAKSEYEWSETGKTGPSTDGNIPYMQLLICEESGSGSAAGNMRSEMVAFFNQRSCPTNWAPYSKLNKRYLLPAPANTEAGQFNQAAGVTGSDHKHTISTTYNGPGDNEVRVPRNEIGMEASEVGVFIPEKNGWAANDSPVNTISTSDPQEQTLVPFIELLPCIKNRGRGDIDELPENMLAFVTSQACPRGWREKASSHGRYLVGLPNGQHAKSGTTFGGYPLNSLEQRTHHHSVNHTFNWPSRPFVGFTGNTNKGFAKAGDYTLTGTTQEAGIALPYVQMRHCIVPTRDSNSSSGIRQ